MAFNVHSSMTNTFLKEFLHPYLRSRYVAGVPPTTTATQTHTPKFPVLLGVRTHLHSRRRQIVWPPSTPWLKRKTDDEDEKAVDVNLWRVWADKRSSTPRRDLPIDAASREASRVKTSLNFGFVYLKRVSTV